MRSCISPWMLTVICGIVELNKNQSEFVLFDKGHTGLNGKSLMDVYMRSNPNSELAKARVKAALRWTSDPEIVRQILKA